MHRRCVCKFVSFFSCVPMYISLLFSEIYFFSLNLNKFLIVAYKSLHPLIPAWLSDFISRHTPSSDIF